MNKHDIKILYLGTPEISAKVLEKLLALNYNIVGVVTQEDKPSGRNLKLKPTPVKEVAILHNIPVFQPKKLNLEYDFISEMQPDLLLTMAYGQIISTKILEMTKLPPLNLHGSLLPKYRGASPIQAALLNGDKKSGITLMEMVKEMDAGKMFNKTEVEISLDDNFDTLSDKLVDASVKCFDEAIQDIIDGKNLGEEQNDSEATFTSKITVEDQVINFEGEGNAIQNKIRALNSEPGTYFVFNDVKYKVGRAIFEEKNVKNTNIVEQYDKNGFRVSCKNGLISILEIQKPGKKMMPIKDFYNGNQKLFEVGQEIKWLKLT